MVTSELEKVLHGDIDWSSFCTRYKNEQDRLLSRKDGAATSSDIGMIFDSDGVVVTSDQIEDLCNAAIEKRIGLSSVQFLSTLIALSGFDYDNDQTEDAVQLLSMPTLNDWTRIYEVLEMLD